MWWCIFSCHPLLISEFILSGWRNRNQRSFVTLHSIIKLRCVIKRHNFTVRLQSQNYEVIVTKTCLNAGVDMRGASSAKTKNTRKSVRWRIHQKRETITGKSVLFLSCHFKVWMFKADSTTKQSSFVRLNVRSTHNLCFELRCYGTVTCSRIWCWCDYFLKQNISDLMFWSRVFFISVPFNE